MAVRIEVAISGLERALGAIAGLARLPEDELLSAIGALGESQTRRRVEETKTGPDGQAWPPNIEDHSILLETGRHLRDSITFVVGAGEVAWGAGWEFAHVHQFGAVIRPKDAPKLVFQLAGRTVHAAKVTIPARPFVGLSEADVGEIRELVTDMLGALP